MGVAPGRVDGLGRLDLLAQPLYFGIQILTPPPLLGQLLLLARRTDRPFAAARPVSFSAPPPAPGTGSATGLKCQGGWRCIGLMLGVSAGQPVHDVEQLGHRPHGPCCCTGLKEWTARLPCRRITSIFVRNAGPTKFTMVGSLIVALRSLWYGSLSDSSTLYSQFSASSIVRRA